MSAATFKNITLIGSVAENHVASTLHDLATHLIARGTRVMVELGLNIPLPEEVIQHPLEQLVSQSDLVITVGGDGTMLRAARFFAGTEVPLVGINRGRLGFLADINPNDITDRIDDVLMGRCIRASRSLLQVKLLTPDGKSQRALAVNDCVLQKFETAVRFG